MSKKYVCLLLVILMFGIGGIALAKGTKYDLSAHPDSEYSGDAYGFVVVNYAKDEDMTIYNIQCFDLKPNCTYSVYRLGDYLGGFMTNKKGHGHVNLQLDGDLTTDGRVNIWEGGEGEKFDRTLWTGEAYLGD
jgi:hypothetical protein